ncbi:ribosome small subunit-dependent GTPase A [Planctomycetaceae bacterium]|nr:ribosome small subunit-dependent GTPase A [bacterium]MDB4679364.1 ribosome small subunit-dependent GTPase A [Planctomycetaceae bacterium]MDC0307856.1 ribosome small subunit-dependent GTPase A [Planctomycetaceae bacterium]
MGKKKKQKTNKVRVQFRKNRGTRSRQNRITEEQLGSEQISDLASEERVSGKGDLSRYRTIKSVSDDENDPQRAIDESVCESAKILSTAGLNSLARTESGRDYECTIRQVVRTVSRDNRNAVVTGDRVLIQPINKEQAVIERVEPRYGTLSRQSGGREHLIVTNVDQALIVVSADDPPLKPNLVDRFLVSAEKGNVEPIICINKADLVEPSDLQPIIGMYSQLGYRVVQCSGVEGWGIDALVRTLKDKQTVLTGQSGVGKSTLINRIQPDLNLDTSNISEWSSKGRHTTRRAIMYPLDIGGAVVDTPGIRQLALWDVVKEEIEGLFVEFRPFVPVCRFPDCSHTHEKSCGVKQAVVAELISHQRYDSYLKILSDEQFDPEW